MIVYRYEYPDGGGPFLTKDGTSRTHPEIQFKDNTLYAATSIEELDNWFLSRNIQLDDNLHLIKYEAEVLYEYPNTGEVIIRKDTARKIKDESTINT